MTPPAWSALPEIDLKRTSTNPFSTTVFGRTHQGKGPLPDCCSTFGLLGADESWRTAHCGLPFPVTPCCHALGSAPGLSLSKLMVSANAALAAKTVATAMQVSFTMAPFRHSSRSQSRAWTLGVYDTGSLPAPPLASTSIMQCAAARLL